MVGSGNHLPLSRSPLGHHPGHHLGRYPWRGGNRLRLLVDGEVFYPEMLAAIDEARETVMLELYLFESGRIAGRFIETFCAASRRGVEVSLLLDDFGARGLTQHDRQRLNAAGVRLGYYNPIHYGQLRRNLFRDHRKLLLVDGAVAFVGGAGITDEFANTTRPELSWHETMVRIEGPVVADWHDLFLQSWRSWSSHPLRKRSPLPQAPGTASGRVSINAPTSMAIKRSLIRRIRQAERRVWIATAYFIPSWKIRRALRRAAREGVDVRLLLPGPHTDHPSVRHAGRRFYASLLRHGVRIFEYQPRFLHAKILLCDEWCSIGSSNIDRWNLRWNLEANQEVEDSAFAREVEQLFTEDFRHSRAIGAEQWLKRPWRTRLREWFWGIIDRWLA